MNLFSPSGGRDTVYFERDGTRSGPYKCNFAPKQLTLFYGELEVQEGDKLVRELPGGKEDLFTIREVNYHAQFGSIPACYKLDISKDSAMRESNRPTTTNHINIHGSTGIQIGDHNIQSLEIALKDVLSSIEKADVPFEEKEEARNRLNSFLQHPLVVAAIGAGIPAAIGLLS